MRLRTLIVALPLFAVNIIHGHADTQLHQRPRYLLRPGDTLQLQYRLTPDMNQTVTVQPDGFVDLNDAGEIQVAGAKHAARQVRRK